MAFFQLLKSFNLFTALRSLNMLFLRPRMLRPVPFSWLTIPSGLFALNETSSGLHAFPDFPHPSLVALNLSYPIFSIVVLFAITCRLFHVWYPPLAVNSQEFMGVLFTYAQGLKHAYREWVSGTRQQAGLRPGAGLRASLAARGLGWCQRMEWNACSPLACRLPWSTAQAGWRARGGWNAPRPGLSSWAYLSAAILSSTPDSCCNACL